jgi:hypothetical protein
VTTRTTTRMLILIAAWWAATVPGEELPTAQTSQIARLSRQQAIQLAFAGLKTSGQTAAKFKVDTARYQPDKHRWLVKLSEVGPMVPFDSNVLAFVDDRTGIVCVKQAIAVGPCT